MPRPLRALGPDLWVVERPQSFYGLVVGTRKTVIRLDDGSLLLHSPVSLDARLQVDQTFFRGLPYENEVVFLHRKSGTLILCDLAFNFRACTHSVTRLLMQLIRSYERFGPSKLDPLLIRDRWLARKSLERILGWDFDRVVVAHGDVLERGGREALRDGYAWLLAA